MLDPCFDVQHLVSFSSFAVISLLVALLCLLDVM